MEVMDQLQQSVLGITNLKEAELEVAATLQIVHTCQCVLQAVPLVYHLSTTVTLPVHPGQLWTVTVM